MQKIGIIGGGAWGTALAQSFASSGKDTLLWAREEEVVSSINSLHENTPFLPNVKLHEGVRASGNLNDVTRTSEVLLLVTPAQHLRTTLEKMKPSLTPDKVLIICAKGVEIETGSMLSQIAKEVVPESPLGILTGPTFAEEIGRGLPCAVTLAMKNKDEAERIAEVLSSRTFRIYASDDVVGAQIGGAVKNVIAIACGVIEGKKLGSSARAALVTRGLAEMGRLASALGAKRETLMGMCGVGDLILTCSSMQSRNFSLGVALGQGKTLAEILASRTAVTEGVHTAKALSVMARNNAVEMPISEAMNKCLSEGAEIDLLIERILDRPLKAEVV
ncbi:MAG: glycerol-3-phosphate acyltransferase [Micavibrio aeruginosavorus]|uniref:Glycerol-3-phosphate dehydrogenase [NAD(P)+] n=1 Tax=Micavibrio aeruginosavorus TaxID=349221 RepID=A0A2W5A2A3_9BACT|nr:MAG: glycerol-3-phosphate acyltransferase [Micavibrio aeruginosavorus]